jgi:DNA-binding NarL/FixJ family response regulator
MNPQSAGVLLADDRARMPSSARQLLASYDGVEVVAEARDGEEAIMMHQHSCL